MERTEATAIGTEATATEIAARVGAAIFIGLQKIQICRRNRIACGRMIIGMLSVRRQDAVAKYLKCKM